MKAMLVRLNTLRRRTELKACVTTYQRIFLDKSRLFSSSKDNPSPLDPPSRLYPKKRQDDIRQLMGQPLQKPAGALWGSDIVDENEEQQYIPEVILYAGEGGRGTNKRILVLCTGGTLTMAPDPAQGGALAPVQGAISRYMEEMTELQNPGMPEYVLHEVSLQLKICMFIQVHDSVLTRIRNHAWV